MMGRSRTRTPSALYDLSKVLLWHSHTPFVSSSTPESVSRDIGVPVTLGMAAGDLAIHSLEGILTVLPQNTTV